MDRNNAVQQLDRSARGGVSSGGSRLLAKSPRLFLGSDLRETFLVGLSAMMALSRPVESWTRVTDQFNLLDRGKNSDRFHKFRRRVAAFFGPDVDDEFAAQLWRAYHNARHRRRMQIVAKRVMKDYRPEIILEGQESLDAGIRGGKGVILWFDNFLHHAVVGKIPFAEAGYVSWQLSWTEHGFSRSRFGHTFLNPIQLSVESSFVAGRIEFDGATAIAATREVKTRLADNSIVRIANNAYIGRRFIKVPIGAAAWLSVATTPLNFARITGATLLPVSVIERVPFRQYSVRIGSPLETYAGEKNTALKSAAQDYVAYLEPLVRAHPEQWITWSGDIDQAPSH